MNQCLEYMQRSHADAADRTSVFLFLPETNAAACAGLECGELLLHRQLAGAGSQDVLLNRVEHGVFLDWSVFAIPQSVADWKIENRR